jgi:hypothetical protein
MGPVPWKIDPKQMKSGQQRLVKTQTQNVEYKTETVFSFISLVVWKTLWSLFMENRPQSDKTWPPKAYKNRYKQHMLNQMQEFVLSIKFSLFG